MMSSPDTVTSGGGSSSGSAGARLASNDMPIYVACVCRAAAPPVASLTRVHVVTPKAPVHVTVQPKVHGLTAPFPSQNMPLLSVRHWLLLT